MYRLGITILLLLALAVTNGVGAQNAAPQFDARRQAILDSLTAEGDTLLAQVARDDKTRFDYYFLEAMRHRQNGDRTAVFELLKLCLELDSTSAATHYYIAQLYDGLKDKKAFARHLNRAAELAPDNTTYLETLVAVQVKERDYAAAIKTCEKIVARETDRADILDLLYQLYDQESDHDNAIKAIERIEVLAGKNEQLSYRKSRIYTRMGNHEAAIAEMKTLADEHPNDPAYRCTYAETLIDNGRDEEAMQIINDVLSQDSANVNAIAIKYSYYVDKKDYATAEKMINTILLSDNFNDETKIGILRDQVALSEQAGGDSTKILAYFDAIMKQPAPSAEMAMFYCSYMEYKKMPRERINKVLERVLEIAPDNEQARFNLTAYAWQKNDMLRVVELCADARRYNPDQMLFYYYQGLAYYRIGEKEKALDAFRNGTSVINDKSDTEIVSDFYLMMGDLLHDKGLDDEAYASYDSCLQWKPDNIGCLNNYAYFLSVEARQLEKAEQMSYKAIKAEPDNATYLDTYAWILFQQERYSEAKVYILQAVEKDSAKSETILEHAGDIHAMAGEREKAVEFWKQALVKDSSNKLLKKKINKRKYLKK